MSGEMKNEEFSRPVEELKRKRGNEDFNTEHTEAKHREHGEEMAT